ncbi:MAG: hypothetical protein HFI00_05015 [Lachnospiraceae bacterium]|jgi:hypothetical protein|nr:hypothetical protein [Lachnospiraceae bacterium]
MEQSNFAGQGDAVGGLPCRNGIWFCGYCEKAVISLMKWPKTREKPP